MTKPDEKTVRDLTEIALLHGKVDKVCGPHQVAVVVAVMCQMLGEACARQRNPKSALEKVLRGVMYSFGAAVSDGHEAAPEPDNVMRH